MEWKTDLRVRFMNKRSLFYFISILLFSVFAFLGSINTKAPCIDIKPPFACKANFHFQELELSNKETDGGDEEMGSLNLAKTRRFLSGPGSSPPRCTSKCGRCTPCKPVHVPVPPGTPVTTEYYPEAWRCKCGNKLYMP